MNSEMDETGGVIFDGCSVVECYSDFDGYACGYCNSPNTNYNYRMWAFSLKAEEFQYLLDRGWSRSGQYLYKPIMHLLCCPMYTIRCSAIDFKCSKSHKKVIKKVNRFLTSGKSRTEVSQSPDEEHESEQRSDCMEDSGVSGSGFNVLLANQIPQHSESTDSHSSSNFGNKKRFSKSEVETITNDHKPVCKKAKLQRLERKKKKLQCRGFSEEEIEKKFSKSSVTNEKSLEDLINEPLPENPAHRLQTVLVPVESSEMMKTLPKSWALYLDYQVKIHNKDPNSWNITKFMGFLVHSPLKLEKNSNGPETGYGTFHEQYWLDDRLIAVGVLDILPKCVCSVYFYYDPEYSDLSLGTYASLREISFTRSLCAEVPSIKDYYMGFYIDSSPKMRYKGKLSPSFLLCPETYTWHPLQDSLIKLQKSKYSRLNDDVNAVDKDGVIDIDRVRILDQGECMEYKTYKNKTLCKYDDAIKKYASMVGMTCAAKLFLLKN